MECKFLPPFCPHLYSLVPVSVISRIFRLHLQANSRLQSRESYQQSGTAPADLDPSQRTGEDEQDATLDYDEVEPIPKYAQDKLEEWTSHLQLTEWSNIHWVCLQSSSLAKSLKEEHSRHSINLDSSPE
eukprot:484425-Rhodomonas_salina.3